MNNYQTSLPSPRPDLETDGQADGRLWRKVHAVIEKLIPILSGILLFVTLAPAADAEPTFIQLRQADKLSLSLTGKPLTDELRTGFIDGSLNQDQLFDRLTESEDFKTHLTRFWLRMMRITNPVHGWTLEVQGGGRVQDPWRRPGTYGFSRNNPQRYTEEFLAGLRQEINSGERLYRISARDCNNSPPIIYANIFDMRQVDAAIGGTGPDGNPPVAPAAAWQALADMEKEYAITCEAGPRQPVNPWFNPGTTYDVPPMIVQHCGDRLQSCSLRDDERDDPLHDLVNQDITSEPGRLIAHIIATDRPFQEVLTSTGTVLSGAFAWWLNNTAKALRDRLPMGAWQGLDLPDFQNPDPYDRRFRPVERNSLHAGVLTTIAWHKSTNGRRAKANRAYEAFLCRSFQVPEGGSPDPTDNNPDLRQRTYCAFCHRSLEPMASFFNRWPGVGTTAWLYNDSRRVDDTGVYDGQSGKGAAAFGRLLSGTESFQSCAVRRAFQFMFGRDVTSLEKQTLLPRWLEVYRQAGGTIRPVLREMMGSAEFSDLREGSP